MTPRSLLAPALAVLLLAAGCGGDGGADAQPSGSPTPEASAGESLGGPDVEVPDGVELTQPGTELGFGDTATVAYVANEQRSSVLELEVTSVREGRISDLSGFRLDDATRATTPYYATVSATNVGEGTLGGTAVPLWAGAGASMLVQSSGFTAAFDTCPSTPLPRGFGPEATYDGCLVYLMPAGAELTGITFRGVGDALPITWTGDVATPTPTPSPTPTPRNQRKKDSP